MTAFFTATSAVTVTGLVVQDTAEYWTRTGQVIILGLMFVGGLGFMTIATFLLIMFGQHLTLPRQQLVRESLGVDRLGGLVRLTIVIVLVAAAIQAVGFLALLVRFVLIYSPAEAVWQAIFHAISGFNNAGFVAFTEPEGMGAFRADGTVLGTIAILAVLGGLSYWVLVDVVRLRRWSLFTLTTKLVLIMTGALILLGALVFLAFEYNNPQTIGGWPIGEKLLASLFQSVNARSVGFSTTDFGASETHTNFLFTGLMFIGGASGSIAGGIKVNTLAVLLVAVISTVRGRNYASAFGREIPDFHVQRVLVIGAIAVAFVFTVALLLTFFETEFGFTDLLFESVSAFGTVGLSTGLTPELTNAGHLILIGAMFLGRLGPLAMALTVAQHTVSDIYRYPTERVTIG
jgi:trk system potassium uptake protein TrkH